MNYKGLNCLYHYDKEKRLYLGEVARIGALYCAANLVELEQLFRNSIDSYLAFCWETGNMPVTRD